jgi:hypothetical protein
MKKTLLWITLFAIAMGYLETAVVIYLRAMHYPGGFHFPLEPMRHSIAVTEFFREVATILMLIGAGAIAGKSRVQAVAYFLYSFAIWDLFYYVFLKIMLNWPESLLSWDLLFLIPLPWVGPVLTPCLVCVSLIAFSLLAIYFDTNGYKASMKFRERGIFILGSLVIIVSFIIDYYLVVTNNGSSHDKLWSLFTDRKLFEEALNYRPQVFAWRIYLSGLAMLWLSIGMYAWRVWKSRVNEKLPFSVA